MTRLDLEAVRGVKCDYSLQSLANKNLVQELGRKDTIGRPILYGTTDEFLSHFGLRTLEDLPVPAQVSIDEEEDLSSQEYEEQSAVE